MDPESEGPADTPRHRVPWSAEEQGLGAAREPRLMGPEHRRSGGGLSLGLSGVPTPLCGCWLLWKSARVSAESPQTCAWQTPCREALREPQVREGRGSRLPWGRHGVSTGAPPQPMPAPRGSQNAHSSARGLTALGSLGLRSRCGPACLSCRTPRPPPRRAGRRPRSRGAPCGPSPPGPRAPGSAGRSCRPGLGACQGGPAVGEEKARRRSSCEWTLRRLSWRQTLPRSAKAAGGGG